MKRNIFVDPDIGNTLKKFTMYFSVFFLVFGLTMIIRNAGDTYAADTAECPSGWTVDGTKCKSNATYADRLMCQGDITGLGLFVNASNYCVLNDETNEYTAYILLNDYVDANSSVITLDDNGEKTTKKIMNGEKYTLPTPSSRKHYTFGGWYKDYYSSGKSPIQSFTVTGPAYFVAHWIPNQYTITFDSDGGSSVDSVTQTYGSKFTLPEPTKDGHSFTGWSKGKELIGVGSYTVEGNATLVAGWKKIDETYKCYVCNATKVATWGSSAPSCSGGTIVEKNDITNSTNCKFLTITYDLKEGMMQQVVTSKYFYGDEITLPSPIREGFEFGGWYNTYVNEDRYFIGNGSTKTTVSAIYDETLNGDSSEIVLVAKWSPKSNDNDPEPTPTPDPTPTPTPGEDDTPEVIEYQVTFSMNGGKLFEDNAESSSLVRKLSNLDYSKYVAKKENNTFNGWSTASACTNPVKTGTLKLENDITLYACYTENEVDDGNKDDGEVTEKKYKVTFKLDGGKLYKSSKETTKTVWELSSIKYTDWTAKKDGHTFKGWSKDKECSKIVGTSEKVTEDMSLWACYDKDETKPSKPSTPDNPTNDKTEDEVDKNQQTGSWFVYMVLILGAVALGYAGYNAYKYSEVRK